MHILQCFWPQPTHTRKHRHSLSSIIWTPLPQSVFSYIYATINQGIHSFIHQTIHHSIPHSPSQSIPCHPSIYHPSNCSTIILTLSFILLSNFPSSVCTPRCSTHSYICLFICPSVYLSICPFICYCHHLSINSYLYLPPSTPQSIISATSHTSFNLFIHPSILVISHPSIIPFHHHLSNLVYQSHHPSIHLPCIHLFISQSPCHCHPLFTHLFLHLSMNPFIHPQSSIDTTIHHPFNCPYIYPSVHPPIHLSIPSIYPPIIHPSTLFHQSHHLSM